MVRRRRSRGASRFRVGRVSVFEHHGSWWVYYREGDRKVRRRVGDNRAHAEQVAAELNAQLSAASPTMFSFTPVSVKQLRADFLRHHEDVLRSSVHTIRRYETATQHLIDFADSSSREAMAHELSVSGFVHFLWHLDVSPNGHPNTAKRRLRDKGAQYILEVGRSLFAFAQRERHLPPYADNPFVGLRLDRMRIDDAKLIFVFDSASELRFLKAADPQQLTLHFFLAKTGMRPGEACHLLVEDLDFDSGWVRIRNKPELGWWIKTGAERSVPLVPELVAVLRHLTLGRDSGPIFRRPKFVCAASSQVAAMNRQQMGQAVRVRVTQVAAAKQHELSRGEQLRVAQAIWREAGALDSDDVRRSFIRVARRAELSDATCPKSWRHSFATLLQDANVDRHGMYIPDTRRRVRRSATHSFHRGGMVMRYPPGYRKLSREEADSGQFGPRGLRIAKLDDWTPIIQEMRHRVLRGDSYPAIAKWLNDEGIPPGKYCKRKQWNGKLVAALLRNGLLSGCRIFRDQMHEYIYSTGMHRRVKNPNPEREDYAELAHLTCEEHQELLEAMAARDPRNEHVDLLRKGVARSKTLFPGQHLKCPICGETMFWASRGHLRCRNAKPDSDHSCWNQTFVSVEHVRTMLLPKLLEILKEHPELRQRLIDTAWSEYERALVISRRHTDKDERRLAELQREAGQLAEAIAKRALDALLDCLEQTQTEIKALQTRLKHRRQEVEQSTKFMSKQDVENGLLDAVLELSQTSFEFGALMRQMFPDFYAYPAQALDTPQVHARVVLRLPTGSAESDSNGPENSESITIDAFEPPLHIANAQRCWTAKQEHPEWSLKRIGKELSLCYMTVKRALAYARLMIARNTTDPYVVLTQRPAEASRWRAQSQCQELSDSSASTPPQTPNDRVDDSEASDSTGTSEAA